MEIRLAVCTVPLPPEQAAAWAAAQEILVRYLLAAKGGDGTIVSTPEEVTTENGSARAEGGARTDPKQGDGRLVEA